MYNGVLVLSIHVSPMFYLLQLCAVLRLNENKRVSGNGSENFK